MNKTLFQHILHSFLKDKKLLEFTKSCVASLMAKKDSPFPYYKRMNK